MSPHDYKPEEALEALLTRIGVKDSELATSIRSAIDSGKDIFETQQLDSKKNSRTYRKTVPFSIEEALQIGIDVLQTYFVESPLFINSCVKDLRSSPVGESLPLVDLNKGKINLSRSDIPFPIEIELRTETRVTESDQETFILNATPQEMISEQQLNIKLLKGLLTFGGS